VEEPGRRDRHRGAPAQSAGVCRFDEAAFAVTPYQRRRILSAARAWLARHPDDATCAIRFDAVLVAPWRLPRHMLGAFDEEG